MKPKIHTLQSGYFPNAMAAIAAHAEYGNDKHNPGEPLHWAFDKSTEHAESASRHLTAIGTIDPETGKSHTIGFAMRALMALETELINAGATPGWAVRRAEAHADTIPAPPRPLPTVRNPLGEWGGEPDRFAACKGREDQ